MQEGSPTLSEQRSYYDNRWSQLDFQDQYAQRRAAMMLTLVSQAGIRRPTILDLGAGTGWFSAVLANFGPVTAVELSPSAVDAARQKYPWVQFIAGNVFEVELPRNSYDLVVSAEVIEHLSDQAGYLQIAHRCLKPHGFLALTTPNELVRRHFLPQELKTYANQPIENWLTPAALRRMLQPLFDIQVHRTFVLGDGHTGFWRVLNSTKVGFALSAIGLGTIHDALRRRLHMGHYQAVLARKRTNTVE